MKVIYEPSVDVLRILFQEVPIAESDEDASGIIFDYDAAGNLVGLEVLSASQQVDNPQATSNLMRQLGPVDTIHFLQQMGWGFGDYTQERQEILGSLTREMFWKDLQRLRGPGAGKYE